MASQTFPKIQSGHFTAPSGVANIHFSRVETVREEHVDDGTGSSAGASDSAKVWVHGVPTVDAVGTGHLRLDADSSFALAESSTISPGLTIKSADWTLRRVWPLVDVTGSGDTEKNWVWGLPIDMVQVRGWATSGGPGFTSNSVTVSTVIDDFGTVSGTLKLNSKQLNAMFADGGPVAVAFSGRYSGAVTYTGSNFSWLFPTAPPDPVKGVLTTDHDTADSVSNSALMFDFRINVPCYHGGKVPVTCGFRFDEV